MNIYHIYWEQIRYHPDGVLAGIYEVDAVVIAEYEKEALAQITFVETHDMNIRAKLLGICTDGTDKPRLVVFSD
jgi:hypothetical protein